MEVIKKPANATRQTLNNVEIDMIDGERKKRNNLANSDSGALWRQWRRRRRRQKRRNHESDDGNDDIDEVEEYAVTATTDYATIEYAFSPNRRRRRQRRHLLTQSSSLLTSSSVPYWERNCANKRLNYEGNNKANSTSTAVAASTTWCARLYGILRLK